MHFATLLCVRLIVIVVYSMHDRVRASLLCVCLIIMEVYLYSIYDIGLASGLRRPKTKGPKIKKRPLATRQEEEKEYAQQTNNNNKSMVIIIEVYLYSMYDIGLASGLRHPKTKGLKIKKRPLASL